MRAAFAIIRAYRRDVADFTGGLNFRHQRLLPRLEVVNIDAQIQQTVGDVIGGILTAVDANPTAAPVLGGDQCGGAAGKGIQHDVAIIAGCPDNALVQFHRFLVRAAPPFFGLRIQGRNIRPNIVESFAFLLVQIANIARDIARFRLHDAAGRNFLPHSLFRPPPGAGHPHQLVSQAGFRILFRSDQGG